MRVICPESDCESPARITNRNQLSPAVADLYCQCTNVFCGHTFVAKLAYSHTLNPSKKRTDQLLFDFVAKMSATERRALVDQVEDNERHRAPCHG